MKLAFLGIGQVGSALAGRFAGLGHDVAAAASDANSASVVAAREKIPSLRVLPVREAAGWAEVLFLATPFAADEAALRDAGTLAGKIVVDCTNPVGPGVSHGLESRISGGEFVQNLVPEARVVKAFTIYGFENLADSAYPGYGNLRPVMLIAGNDAGAKTTVGGLAAELGFEPVDTGDIAMSLHLEHLTLLWVKMGRVQGKGAGFVWGMLTR
jgi:hypothetical protein